jgi:hypothetical protein
MPSLRVGDEPAVHSSLLKGICPLACKNYNLYPSVGLKQLKYLAVEAHALFRSRRKSGLVVCGTDQREAINVSELDKAVTLGIRN